MKQTKTILRRLVLTALLLVTLTAAALAAGSPDEFFAEMEQHLRDQDALFTISYNGDRADLGLDSRVSFGPLQRLLMARSPDGPDSADYYALNVNTAAVTYEDGVYAFDMEYLATQDQMDEVNRQVPEIIAALGLDGLDDEAKIKQIYEYVCTNFVYDETETKFSPYDGLTTGSMVCQGYSLLLNKLLWEAGIPSRSMVGRSQNQNHAWNIVMLDGQWYNLDPTWDGIDEIGQPMKWSFFLKSEADFSGHTRFNELNSADYHASHPMAAESRVLRRVSIQSGGQEVINLVARLGVPVRLDAVLPEGESAKIVWASSNPDVLRVDQEGVVEGMALGETILSAEASGLNGVISAIVSVNVVDLSSASPWASETVTRFYLNQLLPFEMCANFQDNITRSELARLCYQYILKTKGWEAARLSNPFQDVGEDPFLISILRCNDTGIMTGVSSDSFQPQAAVTREQAATVLYRLVQYLTGNPPASASLPDFKDAGTLSAWARDPAAALCGAGIFHGNDGFFRPRDPITLQETIAALDRVFQVYPFDPAIDDAA